LDFIEIESFKIINNNKLLNDEINKLNNRIKQLEINLNNEKEKNKNLNEQIKNYKIIIQELNNKLLGNNIVNNNKVLELENIIKQKLMKLMY